MNISLRSPEPSDVDFLYAIENDSNNWFFTNTRSPYSKAQLQALILASQDPYETGQCRLILNNDKIAIGTVDLFEFDAFNGVGAVGIYLDKAFRKKGLGKKALLLFLDHCKLSFGMHSIICQVDEQNTDSMALFTACGFEKVGVLKQWRRVVNAERKNHCIYQKIL